MKKIDYKYSGNTSRVFWKRIDTLKKESRGWVDDENADDLYALGVMLQNLECHVLQRLRREEERFK